MSEFDEWMDKNHGGLFDIPHQRECFEAGAQSRQAEIDELKKQRDSFIKAHHIAMNDVCEHKAKIDELQARIDEALKSADINFWNSNTVKDMVDILKGNKDEN